MSKRINMPFLPQFKDSMLSGRKTVTSRTSRYGQPGDTFEVWGEVFEIISVRHKLIWIVATYFYEREGFARPKESEACWKAIHPSVEYDPEQKVYVHLFKKLEREVKANEDTPCLQPGL